ncbi:DUF5916 domain-containing protein [Woeseia oceani]|uniref:DUF5916 domain-containing protein n=1 Tax=Woeseia oceani TaxID=1548547 RepID=UPI0018D2A8F3|nr:DUF5916 domain-containing protein [Woeseia oceani]
MKKSEKRARSRGSWLGALLLVATGMSQAQTAGPSSPRPNSQAYPLATVPQLDGDVLNDPAWSNVVPTGDFWQIQPAEGQPASQKTEVFIGFTDDSLYIGMVAYDDNPAGIIVSDSRRDSELDNTDSFQILIDGMRDRQNGFVFGTNPAGLEYDGQVTKEGSSQTSTGGGGFNLNWDASWKVSAKISDIGWSAEFEIPFRTLRYSAGDAQDWGFNFQRNIRRNNEVAFWAPLSRQRTLYRVSEAGTVSGIDPPPQRNLKVTPYILGKAARGGMLSGTETDQEFGFDLKYSITPSLTLDATYNTDFAQVEADEQQVNLDRFSLFFPEKRPFFLENAGQFSVGNSEQVELFFSRRIGVGPGGIPLPIDGGVRLSGKVGSSTNIGFLHMAADGLDGVAPANNFTVARVNQELANRSSVGFLIVNRDGDGSITGDSSTDENQTYAIDGRWGIGDNLLLQGWAAATATPGMEGRETAYSVSGAYDSAEYNMGMGYTEVREGFNPEVGFLSRSEYRKGNANIMRRIRPDDMWGLLEIRPHISWNGYWDFEGFQETGYLHVDSHWEWKSGFEVHTGMNFTKSGVKDPFDIVPGVTVLPGTYDHREAQIVVMTDQSAPFSANVRTVIGGRFGGDRVTLEPTLKYRVGERFSSELSMQYNDFDLPVANGDFQVNLTRLRLSYSFTPKMLLQALVQYNDSRDVVGTNLRFSWLQSANSGLYLVYNEVDDRGIGAPPVGREFILKYSHIFDVFN